MPLTHNSKSYFHSPFHFRHSKVHVSEPASLYITNTLRSAAVSLVGIFLPIYVYTLSSKYLLFHPNEVINGISWILSYYILRSFFTFCCILLFGSTIFSKLHFQLSMVLSFVFLICEILMWHFAQYNLFLILAAGLFAGFKVTFYWVPYHIFFVKKNAHGDKSEYGKKTSFRFFLGRITAGVAPAIGGLIIVNYGFPTLFMTSIVLLILAALPIIFVMHDWEHNPHNTLKVIKKYMLNKKYANLTASFIGEGVDSIIYASFWPILLYFILADFAKIGFITMFAFVLSSLVVLFIGKFIDKHGPKKIHIFGVVVNAILYVPRMFFSSPPLFYSLNVLDKFFSGSVSVPMTSLSYEKARKLGGSDFILFRELTMHLAVTIVMLIIMLSIQALVSWKWVFIPGAIAVALTLFMEVDDN